MTLWPDSASGKNLKWITYNIWEAKVWYEVWTVRCRQMTMLSESHYCDFDGARSRLTDWNKHIYMNSTKASDYFVCQNGLQSHSYIIECGDWRTSSLSFSCFSLCWFIRPMVDSYNLLYGIIHKENCSNQSYCCHLLLSTIKWCCIQVNKNGEKKNSPWSGS